MTMENGNKRTGERVTRDGEKRYLHFIHSPFTLNHRGVKVDCNENGKITLTKENADESYDEIEVPAGLIMRISEMLMTTRRKVWRKEKYKDEEEG